MKRNTIRIFSAVLAVITLCLTLCSCNDSIEARYAKYNRKGEKYDYDLTQYITMPEYKGVEIPDLIYEPTAEDVANIRIKKQVYFSEEYVVEDGVVEMYDLVDCDFVTTVDGIQYSAMCSASNSALRSVLIGIREFDIPEIDDQMLGMAPGETATIEFVFPTPYYRAPMLSGCKGVFTVTIDQIRRQNLAEYTDEFVNEYYGATDTAAYDSTIEAQLESDYSKYMENYEIDAVWEYLLNNTTMTKIPQKEYNDAWNRLLDAYMKDADNAGLLLDDYVVEKLGYEDPNDFYSDLETDVQLTCKEEMMLYTIARCENIVLTVTEYEEALVVAAAELETDDLQLCENYVENMYGTLNRFKQAVLFDKVFTFLGEQATKIDSQEYYAKRAEGLYENVEITAAKSLSKVEIFIIIGASVAIVLVVLVVLLAVKAVQEKKNADIRAAERAALEEKRRVRREMKAAKKKHYGK